MEKKLFMIITSCFECPYIEYDPYYDCSRDSGFDCRLAGRRIINERKLKARRFIEIPDWCPLENMQENLYSTDTGNENKMNADDKGGDG